MARLTAEQVRQLTQDLRTRQQRQVAESVARHFDDAIMRAATSTQQQLELGPFPEAHPEARKRVGLDRFFGDVASMVLEIHDPHIEQEPTDESA